MASVQKFLQDFKYSSYAEYTRVDRPEKVLIDKEAFPEYFENKESFEAMIKFWLEYSSDYTT